MIAQKGLPEKQAPWGSSVCKSNFDCRSECSTGGMLIRGLCGQGSLLA